MTTHALRFATAPSVTGDDANTPPLSAVALRGVSKRYRHFQLNPIDLELPTGVVMGLIGPNGAGKSTTMRLMMGFIEPDAGQVQILGQSIADQPSRVKQDIGYFAEDVRIYKAETIGWHMQLVRSFYPNWDERYAKQLLERFGLIEEQKVKGLSHGQRVKVMLLLILARRPKLLILDEPTNGLDPVAKQEVLVELMRVMEDDQRTIIYSSHNTADVEQISDSIAFIDRGRLIASECRDNFLNHWRRIRVAAPEHWQAPSIEGLRLETNFRSLRVFTSDRYIDEMADRLQASGGMIEAVEPMSLEEIFVSVVQRGREEVK